MAHKLLRGCTSGLGMNLWYPLLHHVPPVRMAYRRMRQVSCSHYCLLWWLSGSLTVIATATVAVVVCFIALGFCVVMIVRKTKTPSRAMSTTTALGSRTTQLGVIEPPPPHLMQQPATDPYPSLPAPPYSLPSEPPPPYPGEETAPPYSPSGQQWLRR